MRAAAAPLTLACAAALPACGTSEEDEVRAVLQEFRRAIDEDDGRRACRLLTARGGTVPDCPRSVASLDPGTGDAAVTVVGDRASIAGRASLVHVDGSWRIDALEDPDQAAAGGARTTAYERCRRAAGARSATTAADPRFAAADMPTVAVQADRGSAKAGDWRIFYTLPPDGRDPGLAEVIGDPRAAGVVAYLQHAAANRAVVERVRGCQPT